MARPAAFLSAVLVVFFHLLMAGCGGTTMAGTSVRVMERLAVTPSSADAQSFSNGQVQFTATATFNMAPTPVMSQPVLWSVGNPPFMSPTPMPMSMSMSPSSTPTITASGVAQCNGFTGIVTIQATAPADPTIPISQMNSTMRVVSAMAQMTCP